MKTNMTESDKRLLVGMFLFVIIVAVGYWGILPQYKRYKKLETKIEQEEDEQKLNKMKIANLALIEMQSDEYEQKIADKKDEFYQVMKSSDIDKMMTELASGRGLDIYELSFTMPTSPTERMAYQYSELYTRQQELKKEYESASDETSSLSSSDDKDSDDEDDADLKSKTTSDKNSTAVLMDNMMGAEEGGYQPNTDIYAVPVTMTVGGEIEDLHAFINDIIDMDKRVLLVGYSWGEFRDVIRRDANGNIIRNSQGSSSNGSIASAANNAANEVSSTAESAAGTGSNETVEVVVRKSLTVRLEIYMCDTTDIASAGDSGEAGEATSDEAGDVINVDDSEVVEE